MSNQFLLPKISFNDADGTITIRRGNIHSSVPKDININAYFQKHSQNVPGNEISDARIMRNWLIMIKNILIHYVIAAKYRLWRNKVITLIIGTLGYFFLGGWTGVPLAWFLISIIIVVTISMLASFVVVIVRTRVSLVWMMMFFVTLLAAGFTNDLRWLALFTVIMFIPLVLRIINLIKPIPFVHYFDNKGFIVGDIDNYIDSRYAWKVRHNNILVRIPDYEGV